MRARFGPALVAGLISVLVVPAAAAEMVWSGSLGYATGDYTLSETTEELSYLADAVLSRALVRARQDLVNRHGVPQTTDARGRLVCTLFEGQHPAGIQVLRWDGMRDDRTRVPSGVYFAELRARGRIDVRQLVLLK